tara:strand:- start:1474 stop:1656 length:183 start_codon:yes stop_codon:yes gene_type:complete
MRMPRKPPEVTDLFPFSLPWRKASSRERSEAIGRYSEKEKKTFLKKGSNNLLNEFHEGRN